MIIYHIIINWMIGVSRTAAMIRFFSAKAVLCANGYPTPTIFTPTYRERWRAKQYFAFPKYPLSMILTRWKYTRRSQLKLANTKITFFQKNHIVVVMFKLIGVAACRH